MKKAGWKKAYGKSDANHRPIVEALKKLGASVLQIQGVGQGAPDILVGWQGRDILMEIKTEKGRVQGNQKLWHRGWSGTPPVVVRSVSEACNVLLNRPR